MCSLGAGAVWQLSARVNALGEPAYGSGSARADAFGELVYDVAVEGSGLLVAHHAQGQYWAVHTACVSRYQSVCIGRQRRTDRAADCRLGDPTRRSRPYTLRTPIPLPRETHPLARDT
eukprot:1025915-Rhodomonas_salina.2